MCARSIFSQQTSIEGEVLGQMRQIEAQKAEKLQLQSLRRSLLAPLNLIRCCFLQRDGGLAVRHRLWGALPCSGCGNHRHLSAFSSHSLSSILC